MKWHWKQALMEGLLPLPSQGSLHYCQKRVNKLECVIEKTTIGTRITLLKLQRNSVLEQDLCLNVITLVVVSYT